MISLGGTEELFIINHINSFSIIFLVWLLVFFIAGLYEKHTIIFKNKIPSIIFNAQIANSILAVFFFYFIPYFSIAPKTNLFIYLLISFGAMTLWRVYGYPRIGSNKKELALIVGGGEETEEILKEINNNSRYNIFFVSILDSVDSKTFEEDFLKNVSRDDISSVVLDFDNEKIRNVLPKLNQTLYLSKKFISKEALYQDVFDRVPLSLLSHKWFIENISIDKGFNFNYIKRLMDLVISIPLFVLSLVFYPFVYIALKIEDGGEIFSHQVRVGKKNEPIKLLKFRTMKFNDNGKWQTEGKENKITKVGSFLRTTRIDELPQLLNVIRGDLSLVGPRPEFPEPVAFYNDKIPYYNMRHLIKPGLSGWAQIYHDNHPHHGTDIFETSVKLSYDLFYIKNRSIILDLKIALRTIKELLSRSGV
jgi:lipopolysaccharide/colanic/teichoic acid biosynthesis glycosyltransferase